jgi:hypothetical protein
MGSPPVPMASKAYLVASTGPTNFTLRLLYQWLGQFATQRADHTVVTLTGPTSATQTVPALAEKVNFTGMALGDYSYSMQTQDVGNNNLGPPMTGRVYYYDDLQVNIPLLIPTSPAIAISVTGGAGSSGGMSDPHSAIPGLAIPAQAWPSTL